jgi:hypothetical protein
VFHFLLCSYFNVCSNIKCFHPSVYCVWVLTWSMWWISSRKCYSITIAISHPI